VGGAATVAPQWCSIEVVRRFIPALAVLAALVAAAPAGAANIREVGIAGARQFQAAGCPRNCEAVGQVSGYQTQIGKSKNPYKIGRKGKIVAFTIALGKPNRRQMRFFTNLYGPLPKARLSILRPQRRGRQARLVAQSGTFNLRPYLGSTPTFGLKESLPVSRGNIVALTVTTWAPAFAVRLGKSYSWRSSRSSSACEDVQQPAAQTVLRSVRSYGCFYRTARLLYSASFVPDPKPTTTTRR
jgi:hypothetical protein